MYKPQNYKQNHGIRNQGGHNQQYVWRGQPTIFDRLAQGRPTRAVHKDVTKARHAPERDTATIDTAAEGKLPQPTQHKPYSNLPYAGRAAAIFLLSAALLGSQGCYAPPKLMKKGMAQKEFMQLPLGERARHSTVDYGTLDEQLGAAIKELSPGRAVQAVVCYPADWLIDMGFRTPKAIVYDTPVKTWDRINPNNAETPTGKNVRTIFLPISAPVVYAYTLSESMVLHSIDAPVETAAHAVVTGLVINAIVNHNSGGSKSSNNSGGGENPPPVEPPAPPPPF
ncbi:MAG: hypothetical protein KKC75_06365 [Nanoarchaeota archaeon]|nr:hypothetical protein [Nanoarchaeota archaeon]MBU1946260.1 hypothetical protein [Nanoarchaeota archaeon]